MKKIWLASAVAVLMGVSLVGCGSASNDETPSVDETESAEAEDAAADESEAADDAVFNEQWYEKSYLYTEEGCRNEGVAGAGIPAVSVTANILAFPVECTGPLK